MATRQIEFTEEKCRIGRETYYKGDRKTFPKEDADEFIRVGWAKCVETGEQGERKPGQQSINVSNVTQTVE